MRAVSTFLLVVALGAGCARKPPETPEPTPPTAAPPQTSKPATPPRATPAVKGKPAPQTATPPATRTSPAKPAPPTASSTATNPSLDDYLASCKDGNRYHVYENDKGRVIVEKQ